MPLGAGALAGSTLHLSPETVAKELGFKGVCANSMDAVSDRDFVLDFIYCSAVCQMHLSRFAEELVLWCGEEFGFIDFPEEFSTGSSLMPQKKNPDSAELIRGKTGRVIGSLVSLFTTMKGLPLTYNRDLQEDKEALFDTADTLRSCLEVMTEVVRGLNFNKERCKQAVESGFLMATDVAEYLVRKGVPFRSAHEIVGKLVRFALDNGLILSELKLEDFKQFSDCFDHDVYTCLDPMRSIRLRLTPGGPAPSRVKERIRSLKKKYGKEGKTF
jgi:argininosuccinate lyase